MAAWSRKPSPFPELPEVMRIVQGIVLPQSIVPELLAVSLDGVVAACFQ